MTSKFASQGVELQHSSLLSACKHCLLTIPNCVCCRVTELEAQRLEETREERLAFRKQLRDEVERQAREKHIDIKLPPDK